MDMLQRFAHRPRTAILRPSPRVVARPRLQSLPPNLVEQSRVVGEGIILFVFFYTSLNYLYYRRIRKEEEEED
jgi:hypothetical protein